MARKLIPFAIAYDFDGTLAPGNMQEHNFIPEIGMKADSFWTEVKKIAKLQDGDEVLIYMGLMLRKADEKGIKVRRTDFRKRGRDIHLYPGVSEWFDRITRYGREGGVRVHHYIISSGLREMIRGTPIAKKCKAIFASGYWYDQHGVAQRPALALNYTTKTQYLFRINKGSLRVFDHSLINKFVEKGKRPVPFEHIIYIGDGETDIPCFRLVKDQGGHSIAVFRPRARGGRKKCAQLITDGRVNFIAPANFQPSGKLDRMVKSIIEKVAWDNYVGRLGRLG